MVTIDITGIEFFLPVFSFLLVFLIVYAILAKTKIIGDNKFVNVLVGFIVAVFFLSFSSLELYVRTITPWFVVLFMIVFFVLLIAGLSTKNLDWLMDKKVFGMIVIVVLIIIFLVAAIRVFNPVFHPDLGIASGEGTSMIEQITDFAGAGRIFGSLLLLVIAGLVAWFVTR